LKVLSEITDDIRGIVESWKLWNIGVLILLILATISCGGSSSGGSSSNNNLVPKISSLSPAVTKEGSASLTLTINGSGFITGSAIKWNGTNQTTIYVNSKQLRTTIGGAELASAGTVAVTVYNPTPGGGTSSAATFTITTVDPLTILTTIIPNASHKKNYNYLLQADGGISPFTWSLINGGLPSGLSLSDSGVISGTPPSVANDTPVSFAVQVRDSSYSPRTTIQAFTLLVNSGDLGRNDACPSTPSAISNGTIRASLSPYGDVDVYSFHGTAGDTITAQIYAQSLLLNSGSTTQDVFMDSFLELLDSNCNRIAYSDDIYLGISTDSKITNYKLSTTGTYYLRVSDMRGDGRPDFIYELDLSGAH
jgi:hypothetical protein